MVSQAVGEGMSAIWGARYAWCDQETSEGFISVVRSVATVAAVVFTFFALAGVPPGMAPSVSHGLKLTTAMMKGATCNWNPAMITFSVAAITDFVCHLLQMKSTKDEDAERIRTLEAREAELLATNQSLVEDNKLLTNSLNNKGFRLDIDNFARVVSKELNTQYSRLDSQFNIVINTIHRLNSKNINPYSGSRCASLRDLSHKYDSLDSPSCFTPRQSETTTANVVSDTESVASGGQVSSVNDFVEVSVNGQD